MAIKLKKFSGKQSAEAMENWAYKVARDYNSEIKGILESGGSKSQILAAMDEEIKKICKQLDKKEDREFSEDPSKILGKRLYNQLLKMAKEHKEYFDENDLNRFIDKVNPDGFDIMHLKWYMEDYRSNPNSSDAQRIGNIILHPNKHDK